LTSFDKFIYEIKRFSLIYNYDSLIYLEPVERFKNRSSLMKLRSFGDVKDKLETMCLCSK